MPGIDIFENIKTYVASCFSDNNSNVTNENLKNVAINIERKISASQLFCKTVINDDNFNILRPDYAVYSQHDYRFSKSTYNRQDPSLHARNVGQVPENEAYYMFNTVSEVQLALHERLLSYENFLEKEDCACDKCLTLDVLADSLKHPFHFEETEHPPPKKQTTRSKRKKHRNKITDSEHDHRYEFLMAKLHCLEDKLSDLEDILDEFEMNISPRPKIIKNETSQYPNTKTCSEIKCKKTLKTKLSTSDNTNVRENTGIGNIDTNGKTEDSFLKTVKLSIFSKLKCYYDKCKELFKINNKSSPTEVFRFYVPLGPFVKDLKTRLSRQSLFFNAKEDSSKLFLFEGIKKTSRENSNVYMYNEKNTCSYIIYKQPSPESDRTRTIYVESQEFHKKQCNGSTIKLITDKHNRPQSLSKDIRIVFSKPLNYCGL